MTIAGAGAETRDVVAGARRGPSEVTQRPLHTWLAVGVIAVVGGALPLLIAHHFGALGIPRNDDWAYAASAFRFADHGTINGNGWAAMNLVGHLVLAAPVVLLFGHRITPLQIEVAVIGVLGLVAVYDLARRLLSPARALFLALMVAVGPIWASLAASFMTDVPAFALAMISLALGGRALRDDDVDRRLYVAALVVGFLGFSVREYALVAPLAVAIATVWLGAHRYRARVASAVAVLVGLVAAAAVFVLWRRGLPDFHDLTPVRPDPSSLRSAFQLGCQSAVLLGVLVTPAVVLAGPMRLVRAAWTRAPRTSVVASLVTVVALAVETSRHWSSGEFLGPGNYVTPTGTLDTHTISGARPDLLPKALLLVLAVGGIAAVLLVVLAAIPPTVDALAELRTGHLPAPSSPALVLVGLAAIGFGLAYVLPGAFRVVEFDRYLLPLVPLVGVLVLRAGRWRPGAASPAPIAGGLTLAALALFGLVFAMNAAAFDGTKWNVAEEVTRTAGGARHVEGGFEWDDHHAGHEVFFGPTPDRRPVGHFCVVLRAETDKPHGREILRTERVWGPPGADLWIVARRHPC